MVEARRIGRKAEISKASDHHIFRLHCIIRLGHGAKRSGRAGEKLRSLSDAPDTSEEKTGAKNAVESPSPPGGASRPSCGKREHHAESQYHVEPIHRPVAGGVAQEG